MLELRTLTRPKSPNHYLIAPEGFGSAAADEVSPAFPLPPERLFDIVRRAVRSQPRTTLIEDATGLLALEARQRTPLLGFKDDVTIEVVPLGEGRSALALYSRSRIGYSDLGTNRRRARAWLHEIAKNAGAAQEAS